MNSRPTLLDLFCGAGGAAEGYRRAGFDVTGVDLAPQPRFPFRFIQADALDYLRAHGREYHFIHASPPCQSYSRCASMPWVEERPKLLPVVRELLREVGRPYIIENVPGAPMQAPVTLCGLMFGLKVFRHRLFESSEFLMQPPHPSHDGKRLGEGGFCCVAGHGDGSRRRIPADHRNKAAWERAMGIDWMTRDELAQAIPPAYTHFLGRQVLGK